MKTRYYVIVGIIAYLLFLIAALPASLVIEPIDDELKIFKARGIGGTLWEGTARQLTINKHRLNDVSWSVCSWRLLTAEASADIKALYKGNPIKGQIGIGVTGTVNARDLKAQMDAEQIGKLADLPLGELSGKVTLQLSSASWAPETPPTAVGTLLWSEAAVTVAETAELGNIKIDLLDTGEFPVQANITNQGGQIALSGETRVDNEGGYTLELKLTPNQSATDNLRNSLKLIATKQNDGSFLLKNTGNLKQHGIM